MSVDPVNAAPRRASSRSEEPETDAGFFGGSEPGETGARRMDGIAARALGRRAEAASANYLAGLNPEQRLAVETTEGRFWCWAAPAPARPAF